MATLAISSSNTMEEAVTIKTGEVWQIDKYTTRFYGSKMLRDKNAPLFKKFKKQYPNAGNGYVKLFIREKTRYESAKEWIVLYEKHLLAFESIIRNPDFMQYYLESGSAYFSSVEEDAMEKYWHNLDAYMTIFCNNLKEKDSESGNYQGGGPSYYGFVRDIIYHYTKYLKTHKEAKSIDSLYEEYFKKATTLPPTRIEEESILQETKKCYESDEEYFSSTDQVEPHYRPLHGFLGSPEFDRYYEDLFTDSYLFILGTKATCPYEKLIYQKWYEYAEDGFEGTIVCPELSKNGLEFQKFSKASIAIFPIFRKGETETEKLISLAILNKTEVIIELYDASLFPKYAQKYPEAVIVLASLQPDEKTLDETDEFMIACYNNAREKRYYK